jgi:hypothetical protein
MPEYIGFPVEMKVTPNPSYVQKLFAQVKPEKRTEYVSREAFLQDPALYQQELQEDEPLKMIPYEAWAAQQVAPNPILNEKGEPKFAQPTIKPGVQELFKSNPELASVGTPQQYSQYLDTIFPNSKVKDIVYHGTSNLERVRNEGFDKSKLKTGEGTNLQGAGFYFAKFKQVLSSYAKGEKGGFIQALINVRNPLQEKNFPEFLKKELNETNVSIGNVIEVGEKVDKWLEKNNKDGVVWNQISSFKEGTLEQEIAREKLFGSAYNKNQKILDVEHYSVKEPEQIHILGSKQDIEGFKKFVKTGGQLSLIQLLETPIAQVPDVAANIIYQNQNCK